MLARDKRGGLPMTAPIFDLTAEVKAKGMITAEDVLAIRHIVWPDGRIDPTEADAIFDLNSAIKQGSREWVDFFVEAIEAYLVHEQSPVGYVDDFKAAWLMKQIDNDGRVDSLGELELLVKIFEDATTVPEALKSYALKQVETIVVSGTGPTRDGGSLQPGTITAAEVKLLRRLLFAQASDGPAIISTAEADLLFRLKDATLGGANAPEWSTFFVQAVGNHLMAHTDYHPLSRDRAAQLDAFMNDNHPHIGGFFGRVMSAGSLSRVNDLFGAKATLAGNDDAVAADQAITPEETAWLKSEVDADRNLDPIEKSLLKFIADESGSPLQL
jgi:hypothetical protein